MQRLVSICTRTPRLVQVMESNYSKSLFKRTLASKNPELDSRANLYKASTTKKQQQVPSDLKTGQPPETFADSSDSPISTGGKVWSVQHPDDVHIAPLGRVQATTFTASAEPSSAAVRETTVYTTQGELNIADPFTTHTLKPDATPQQAAEAAAASAFETFASPVAPPAETVFAPKISSTEVYSTTMSPTANFDSPVSTPAASESTSQNTIKYETAPKGKVFGGQDTTAYTKKHPKENPFNLKEKIDPSPITNETETREKILHESLKYVHEKGWSMDTIRAGIQACQESNEVEKLFYNGYDLVEYFMRDANSKMVDYMNELATKENLQGNRLLIAGLKYRLQLVIPYADIWEQALAQKGFPPNAKRAWKSLLDLANDAWISSGDTATDIKWYTKRLSIATIYRSAEIYMLQDQSTDKIETINFLERHLADYQITGTVRPSVSQSLSDTAQVASGLFTVVRKMTTRR